jgi:hypothetical protein
MEPTRSQGSCTSSERRDKLNPNLAALVTGVKKAGISPLRFAGGHGAVADYAPLAALEGK